MPIFNITVISKDGTYLFLDGVMLPGMPAALTYAAKFFRDAKSIDIECIAE